ncbi:MAG: type II and III secretion system family protein [Pseudobdellovibrionaceae bacterium]|jgi:general secretion pathway protein D|nr:type II and III secretion system family protein [Pseudobdellovibrionaceae bacterium]
MTLKAFPLKTTVTSLIALSVFLPASGCDLANNYTKIDRTTNSEFQDYRDGLAPRDMEFASAADSSNDIPSLQPYVAENVQALPPMPLVSIAINQSIPLREALFELAKQANYDIELDPRITGSIIFTARNRPMDVVIDRICEISGLRYKFDENTLRIELDTPYTKNYKIDYLSFVRKNSGSMQTDVSVESGEGGGEGGVSGGSKFTVESTSDSDFWAELDTNIKQILESNSTGSYLKTAEDPQITLTAGNANNPPVPPLDGAALQGAAAAASVAPQAGGDIYVTSPVSLPSDDAQGDPVASVPSAATQPTVTTDTAATSVQAPQPSSIPIEDIAGATPAAVTAPPVLRVESLPSNLSGGSAVQNEVTFTPSYSMNKQAGIVSVYANERLHRKIDDYLDELKRSVTSQVLIEAKVLEVSLSDEFATGIDWSLLDRVGDFSVSGSFAKPAFDTLSTNVITFGFAGDDISSFVSALSRFGTVHALASPRLTVLNNQSAVLNVAKNQVYFKLDLNITQATVNTAGSTEVDSEIKTVPEGVLINVLPSINLDKRMVSMQVRPTVTKIKEFVSDPGVAFVAASAGVDIDSKIPVVSVQEVDSVLNMNSGEIMVMGGLLQDGTTSTQEGVPVAKDIPVFGGLFRNQGDKVSKTELVIFMKATILDTAGQSIHQTDKELYRMFGQDRRPVKM